MLSAGPSIEGRIAQEFEEHEAGEVVEALELPGRAARHDGRTPSYSVPESATSASTATKLDGLTNLLDNLHNVIGSRFFGRGDPRAAFARTLSLRIHLPGLQDLDEAQIWARVTELEARISGDEGDIEVLDLSILWGPPPVRVNTTQATCLRSLCLPANL